MKKEENKKVEKSLEIENNFYLEELEDRLEMSSASIDPHNLGCVEWHTTFE